MKKSILFFYLLIILCSCKQTTNNKEQTVSEFDTLSSVKNKEHFTESFKTQFAGTWQKETEFQTNTIEIQFEAGKNYATVIDIGSGEAPPIKLQALPKDNKLFINAEEEHIQLEVKNNQLIFRIQPTTWNKDSTSQKTVETVFKKVRK